MKTDEPQTETSEELDLERKEHAQSKARIETLTSDIEKLKEQLARSATDNETLTEQNAKLHDEAQAARKQAQETADMNDLLVKKSQRLEQDNVELGKQRDRFREGFDRSQRQIAELMERLRRQKLLEKPEPGIVDG